MVKVLIDGKEYEGKLVEVKTIEQHGGSCTTFTDFVKPKQELSPGQMFRKIMAKPDYVSVPKEIQFGWYYGTFGLIVGRHHLSYEKGMNNWQFIPYNKELNVDGNRTEDCILVPISRDKLKAGDWAFWDFEKEAYHTKDSSQYDLILNEKDSVHILSFENKLIVEENRELLTEGINWFKVVPRNEIITSAEQAKKVWEDAGGNKGWESEAEKHV